MSLYLFIFLPVAWALAGKLYGLALTAAFFYSESGKRLGRAVARWTTPGFPLIYLGLMLASAEGNAGHGLTIFGNELVFAHATVAPLAAVVVLGGFAGVVYVLRDLTVGAGNQANQSVR